MWRLDSRRELIGLLLLAILITACGRQEQAEDSSATESANPGSPSSILPSEPIPETTGPTDPTTGQGRVLSSVAGVSVANHPDLVPDRANLATPDEPIRIGSDTDPCSEPESEVAQRCGATGALLWRIRTETTGAKSIDVFVRSSESEGEMESVLSARDLTGTDWESVAVASADLTADGEDELLVGIRHAGSAGILDVDIVRQPWQGGGTSISSAWRGLGVLGQLLRCPLHPRCRRTQLLSQSVLGGVDRVRRWKVADPRNRGCRCRVRRARPVLNGVALNASEQDSGRRTRVLVTGAAGLLGSALCRTAPNSFELLGTLRSTPIPADIEIEVVGLDLADAAETSRAIEQLQPSLIIHTACTQNEREDIISATENVASGAASVGARLVHLSSDAVFSGSNAPYDEASEIDGAPNDYGRWKAEAESAVLRKVPSAAIVRTSLLVSLDPIDPRTAAVVDALSANEAPKLFIDELRCPLHVEDLAVAIWRIVGSKRPEGVWHIAGSESLSRYSLGVLLANRFGLDPTAILPTLSAESPQPRALDSRMVSIRARSEISFSPRTMAQVLAPHTL